MKNETARRLVWLAMVLWLLLLAKFILFKKVPSYYWSYFSTRYEWGMVKKGWGSANWVPFATIRRFYNSNRLPTAYKVDNIGGNILGFIPLAYLLCHFYTTGSRSKKALVTTALISLGFEGVQLVTALGAFDIDDLILNTFGGLLGIGFFSVTRSLRRR
jgi:glycopeptide antibiotics resistance protein